MNLMKTDRLNLMKILIEKSVSYGGFSLSSGKESNYYVDSKLTTYDPKGVYLAGKLIFEKIKTKNKKITAVGGLTMGADPVVISTIMAAYNECFNLKGFSVRKDPKSHGKRKLIEGNLDIKDKVVILDDVITTGNSTIKAIEAVNKFGSEIVLIVALVDRCEGGTEKIRDMGYDFETVFKIDELLNLKKVTENSSNANYTGFNFVNTERILQKKSV